MKPILQRLLLAPLAMLAAAAPALAGGTLTLQGSPDLAIQILDHHVEVLIQNGFARTEVTQTFFNPNERQFEGIYRVPVPIGASLSEMHMRLGELELTGEVVARDKAREAYEEEQNDGAGLAEKNAENFDFSIAPIPPLGELSFSYVYYQPVELDTGVGRFLYPLEDGGTDDLAQAFWTQASTVQRSFSFHARIDSVWPIKDVRLPGFAAAATITEVANGSWDVLLEAPGGVELDSDLIVYYRLADDLPGRMEMLTYRPDPSVPGTFMLVVTPGVDLAPLTGGVDYVFVLDNSGSMEAKLGTLARGVAGAIEQLDSQDRFRIVTFSDSARDLTRGFRNATQAEVDQAVAQLEQLRTDGGTNLYKGLREGLDGLDADRATSLILVTDGVANQGIVDPVRFDKLMRTNDVRLFGFLMGNSANWPLMRTITEASGGFYTQVSNADDVIGQILLAKSKVTHAALHDAQLTIKGVTTYDTGLGSIGKVYRGQQLVVFGRYDGSGEATIELRATLTGADKVYSATYDFPEFTDEFPELERLWALDRIDRIGVDMDRGKLEEPEGAQAIRDLGVAYQLVTDETSMLVLRDAAFAARGIERANKERTATERHAQGQRVNAAPRSRRFDNQSPAFGSNAPRLGSGGGAFGPLAAGLALLLSALASIGTRRRRSALASEEAVEA